MRYFTEMYCNDTTHPICTSGENPEVALQKLKDFCSEADWEFRPEWVTFWTAEPTNLKVRTTHIVEEKE